MWVNKGALFLAKFIFLVPKCTKIHLTGFLANISPYVGSPQETISPPPPRTFKPPSLPHLTVKLNVD